MEPAGDNPTDPKPDQPNTAADAGTARAHAANGTGAGASAEEPEDQHPARALTLHLLRMLETRMDAAGIALQSEVQSFSARIQLKLLAAAAVFIAIWGAIVLLAIALPDPWRIPVLGAVVAGFVLVAIWATLAANKRVASREVGSMAWFLESLKLDLEVLSRALSRARAEASTQQRPPERTQ
jgi:uncharacterized membrane protein YqjE